MKNSLEGQNSRFKLKKKKQLANLKTDCAIQRTEKKE